MMSSITPLDLPPNVLNFAVIKKNCITIFETLFSTQKHVYTLEGYEGCLYAVCFVLDG